MAYGNVDDRLMIMSPAMRKLLPVPDNTTDHTPANNRLRAMQRSDTVAVEALFKTAFAKGRPTDGLAAYLETVFFDGPHYSKKHGSLVYDDGDKGITAALLSLPMPFIVHGQPVMARLLCAFMSNGTRSGMAGAVRINRSLSQGKTEFCFTDNASPVSTAHWLAAGGITLPVQSLEWRRAFHPLGSLFSGSGCARRMGRLRHIVRSVLRIADRAVLAWKPALTPQPAPGCTTKVASPQLFHDHAEEMTRRFAVRPVWSQGYFDWLLQVIAMNPTLGPLQCRAVEKDGRTIGVYLFAGHKRATAQVLNFICHSGHEQDVATQMFASLASEGYVDATGMAQPFMMNAIMRQRRLTFQHRGYFCIQSNQSEVIDTIIMGDLYIGGLASESWSRLVTDF